MQPALALVRSYHSGIGRSPYSIAEEALDRFKLRGTAGLADVLNHLSQARQTRTLEAGVAGTTLFRLWNSQNSCYRDRQAVLRAMNPLIDRTSFLLFYVSFGGSVLLASVGSANSRIERFLKSSLSTDPYPLPICAAVRTRRSRVARYSLIDRGLLVVKGHAALGLAGNRHHQQPDRKGTAPKFLVEDEATSIYKNSTLEAPATLLGDSLQAGVATRRDHATDRMTRFI